MANYTTTANVVLHVNGRQAKQMMDDLQKKAEGLSKRIDEAARSGDKVTMKKLNRELRSVQGMIDQINGSTKTADKTLRNLDKASPKQLKSALKELEKSLNNIERGSAAWDKQVEKIKAVRAELQRVNASMREQESGWSRMNRWLNNTQTFLMGLAASVSGLVMAGRKAVNAFAEMDEQLANTRKYTGLTEKQVEQLNDTFKKMDTRLGREQLNLLAQEAGRLGKNTLSSVQDYVEAAQIINVALVDLGEGATQTIAKIANIFGVEQQLGTKQAMLSIGSAVNVLSQNCTASKPYLVDFAQRMAGIGAQAGLTVPQILAFGAVLDANGQKVEMSATAFQKVIMNLANKNKEFAETLGLDAEKLEKTLRKSAKDGIIMYLEAIKKLADKTSANNATVALAPLFKDMGMDAARVASVLSTLATHLDEVNWQLGNADKAFREASSATNEFNIFNNTAQATISKAKARVHELAVELGEQLFPIMKHIYSASSLVIRAMSIFFKFLFDHGDAIAGATAAIVAYTAVVKIMSLQLTVAAARTKALAAVNAVLSAGLNVLKGVWLACEVAAAKCTGNVTRMNAAMKLLNATTRLNPFAAFAAVLAAVGTALTLAYRKTTEFRRALDDAMKSTTSFAESAGKEQKALDQLFNSLRKAKKGSEEYNEARDVLVSKYGRYINFLIDEKKEVKDLELAYSRLTFAVQKSAAARGIEAAKEKLDTTYFEKVDELTEQLRKSLTKTGMDSETVNRIVTKVSQSLAAGQAIPEYIQSQVWEWSSENITLGQNITGRTPQKILMQLNSGRRDYEMRRDKLESMDNRYLRNMPEQELEETIISLNNHLYGKHTEGKNMKSEHFNVNLAISDKDAIDRLNESITFGMENMPKLRYVQGPLVGGYSTTGELTFNQAEKLLQELMYEASLRDKLPSKDDTGSSRGNADPGDFTTYDSGKDKEKAADRFAAEKQWREKQEALARISYATGESDYIQYTDRMNGIAVEFFKKQLGHSDLSENERLSITASYQEAIAKLSKEASKRTIDEENAAYNERMAELKQLYIDGQISYEAYSQKSEELEIEHQRNLVNISKEGSKERLAAEASLQNLLLAQTKKQQNEIAELKKKYTELSAVERFKIEKAVIDKLLEAERISIEEYENLLEGLRNKYGGGEPKGGGLDDAYEKSGRSRADAVEKYRSDKYDEINEQLQAGMISSEKAIMLKLEVDKDIEQEAYEKIKKIGDSWVSMVADINKSWTQLWSDFMKNGEFSLDNILELATNTFAVVSAGMQMASKFAQANAEIEVAKIEKRYDREIQLAEGNSYRIAKLEKEKDKKVADAKNKASQKSYQMQVIQAVAQAIIGSMSAYNAALGLGAPGLILAPIMAGVALAAGMANVALLKKQQEAAAATGYSEGGFTPKGRPDEPVGIVHAGEWVASQRLVNNPRVRPVLEALEYAQRTNTVGSLSAGDVSRSITAPMVLAQGQQPQTITVAAPPASVVVNDNPEYVSVMRRLADRLDEPFVTINTVSGDHGIQRALDQYDTMISNKSPKSKKK